MKKLLLYWPIIAAVLAWSGSTIIEQAQSYDKRIDENKKRIDKQGIVLDRMDYNIQIIGKKVGVVPLKPTSNE